MNSNAPDEIKSAFEEQTEMHRALLKSMQETITLLRDSLKQKDDTIKSLQQQIANLNKVIFGSRSEKTIYVDPAQKSLFPEDTPENQQVPVTSKLQTVEVTAHERKPKRSRKEIYDNLPHKEEIIDLPESERFDANGRPLVRVGKVFSRTEVRSKPAEHWCVDYYTIQYKAVDSQSGTCQFVSPDVPTPLLNTVLHRLPQYH